MKINVLFILIISPFLILFQSNELSKNTFKKVSKEIKTVYDTENFSFESISLADSINSQLKIKINDSNLFKIVNDSTLIGYAFFGKAPSKTDEFDYLVLFDSELIITKSKVLAYREDYGNEIGSKRWLKQFIGLQKDSEVRYGNEIVPISGATISARSMTIAINDLLKTVSILNKNGII